jgi:DNA-binding CsgD family transcriptional regulator
VTDGLGRARRAGCEVGSALADELTMRFPLRAVLDCLGIESRSADPVQVGIAAALRAQQPAGLIGAVNPVSAATELLLGMVDQVCAAGPLVLAIDDLQWADEASLALWRRLVPAVPQLPLLLVAASRPVPRREDVTGLRQEIVDGGGAVIPLGPLAPPDVDELITELVGAPPGRSLRRLTDRAAGNPLYLRETVDALLREKAVHVARGTAEVATDGYEPPPTLTAAISRRLGFLSDRAGEMLQVAALLGRQFEVAEVAAVTGVPADRLDPVVEEAVAAGVLAGVGEGRTAFRHPLIRQAFHDRVPATVRSAVHRHAAQALAGSGAPAQRVAAHLVSTTGVDGWVVDWLAGAGPALTNTAPQIAVELLQRAVDQTPADDPRRDRLVAMLSKVLQRLGRDAEAEQYIRLLLTQARDPDLLAEARWMLAYVQERTGRPDAVATIDEALADPALPGVWRARMQALLAMVQADLLGDPDLAEATARDALAQGEAAGDRFAMGYALHLMSWVCGMRRDNIPQVALIDRALAVLDDDLEQVHLRLILHHNRMYALTILDRIADAAAELARARRLAERVGNVQLGGVIHLTSAVHYVWTGRWDDALAELDAMPDDPKGSMLLVSAGVKALVAARRDDRPLARRWLAAVPELPSRDAAAQLRDNCHFLLAARAVTAERDGNMHEALAAVATVLTPEFGQMTLRYWLLPDVVRLALAVGHLDTAAAAVKVAEAEAADESAAGKAAAAGHCRGLLAGDPAPVLAAADRYRAVGRTVELARALEDGAVLQAAGGDTGAARAPFTEAVEIYTGLGAAWDVRRADTRIRPYGVRRGARGPRRRPTHGWPALSPTELTVARLVARGMSNPDIAAELLLSRRTVQSHVSSILTKLDVHSRVEIARETMRH